MMFPAVADDAAPVSLFPADLFSAGVGYDFDFNPVVVAAVGLIGIYDVAEIGCGYGGSPKLYDALAIGGDLNLRKLTREKVRWLLDDTDVKLGLWYLGEFYDKEDGTRGVINRGAATLSVAQAF